MLSDILSVDLAAELELDKLPAEKRDGLIQQMNDTLDSRVSIALMSRLSDDDKKALGQLLDENKDVTVFLKEKLPDYEMIVAETVAGFKQELLELHGMIQQQATPKT